MSNGTTAHLVGIYPSIEPFGKKVRSALRQLGLKWVQLRSLTEVQEQPSLLLINGAALEGGEKALKQVLSEKLSGQLRFVPAILLDPPDGNEAHGWAEGYEARLSLACSHTKIAEVVQEVLSHQAAMHGSGGYGSLRKP